MAAKKAKAKLAPKGKALLKAKIRSKRKAPEFKRQEFGFQKTLKEKWRRPRGKRSKMRMQRRGRGKLPKPGYGSPVSVRGLDRHGFALARVSNPKELERLNPESQKAVIASAVGRKKRLEILKKARELGIAVSNA